LKNFWDIFIAIFALHRARIPVSIRVARAMICTLDDAHPAGTA